MPPAKTVTLHLRDKKGGYAGPLVVGGKRSKVIVGLKAGAVLGKLRVKRGYATLAKPLKARALNKKRTARASKGVPLGAGKLGLVRVPATGGTGPGRDFDLDGLPGAFDVDDDGDMQLDNVDAGQATASSHTNLLPDLFHPWWVVNAGLEVSFILDDKGVTHGAAGYALNQNAAGPFAGDAEFGKLRDTIMKDRGTLLFRTQNPDDELDCGEALTGLSYCRPGGTGFAHNRSQKFPDQFDTDNDGSGTMTSLLPTDISEGQDGLDTFGDIARLGRIFGIAPLAGDGAIKSGDAFIQRITNSASGEVTAYPSTLNTVFETVPALQGWSDGTTSQTISYPVLRGGAGSESTPFELERDQSGAYVLRLNVWRPQRRPVTAAEGTGWIDQGRLAYGIVGKTVEQQRRVFRCRFEDYRQVGPDTVRFTDWMLDLSADEPVNPQRVVQLSVNLSTCLQSQLGLDWQSGSVPVDIFIGAHSWFGDVAEGGGFAFKPKAPGPSSEQFRGTWSFPGGVPGSEINWTVTANGAETSHFAIIVYAPYDIETGTTPPGWTCKKQQIQSNSISWDCTGSTLHSGESVSGGLTLRSSGQDNMPLDLLICDSQNQCKGFGMTQQK